jgi:lipoprotein-anchoring transpeptidase ErfK/SrfK
MKPPVIALVLATMAGCSSTETIVAGKRVHVLLAEQAAYFWKDGRLVRRLSIVSGAGISPETTTYPGEYRVYEKDRGPRETAPGIFVRDIVIFDYLHRNAFHSASMTADGESLEDRVGHTVTAGCIRVRDSDFVYRFIDADTQIVIH